ncbi:hypothetical protein ABT282_07210 [Streptomyces sp. NPDC000927]|uniref:hypothetical protein n=1 Tax=Streptomyces sp. NPDC000927 TaxID=3154371 RepID=UPI003318639A
MTTVGDCDGDQEWRDADGYWQSDKAQWASGVLVETLERSDKNGGRSYQVLHGPDFVRIDVSGYWGSLYSTYFISNDDLRPGWEWQEHLRALAAEGNI